MKDTIVRAIAKDAGIQITAAYTREMVERARQIHHTLPVATAALGRTLTAASIMGNGLKAEHGSITLQVKGNGILGTIVAVSDAKGNTRGYLQNPAADLPLRADGKLDVGGAVGCGYLMVIKDVGMRQPMSGTVALVNGEIAEDVTRYFAESEQIPSACALGVLVEQDQSVKQAGGYLVQLMPGVTDAQIDKLEDNIARLPSMTTMLEDELTLHDIIGQVLYGFVVEFLEEDPISYRCACSRTKVTGALVSLGREELTKLAEEQQQTELTCQFCDKIYTFTAQEVGEILQQASAGTPAEK